MVVKIEQGTVASRSHLAKIVHVNTMSDIQESSSGAVFIKVSIESCGPCKALQAFLESSTYRCPTTINCITVSDRSSSDIVEFVSSHDIRSVPAFFKMSSDLKTVIERINGFGAEKKEEVLKIINDE